MAYLAIAENPDGALVFQVGPTFLSLSRSRPSRADHPDA